MSIIDLPHDVLSIILSDLTPIEVNSLILTCYDFYNPCFVATVLINKYKFSRKDLSETPILQYNQHHRLILSLTKVPYLEYMAWSISASNVIDPEVTICDNVIPGGVMRYWKVEDLLLRAVKLGSPYLVDLTLKQLIPKAEHPSCFYASMLVPFTSAILNDKSAIAEILFIHCTEWHRYWIKQILDKLPGDKVVSFKSRLQ